MKIKLNKVGIDINGKVYNFYKMNFGTRRKLVEIQNQMTKLKNDVLKNNSIDITSLNDEAAASLPEKVQMEMLELDAAAKNIFKELLVDQSEAEIIDMLQTDEHIQQLAEALA